MIFPPAAFVGSPKKVSGVAWTWLVMMIATLKISSSYAKSTKTAAKEIMGTCVSLGITVEGKDPREVQKEVAQGKWDQLFEKEK